MALGRGRRAGRKGDTSAEDTLGGAAQGQGEEQDGDALEHGPWDSGEVETEDDGLLDLGSVRVPLPEGGQIQVEMDNAGAVRSVHLATPAGRLTVAAFAAPRSGGLWREVAAELAEGLRTDEARVSTTDGPWGREVVGTAPGGAMRFLGVDGPRWMVRCVAHGPAETAEVLARTARAVLRGTVVVRGDEPMPVRTTLPVVLPPALVEQLAAAQAQAVAQAEAQAQAQAQGQPAQAPPEV